MCASALWPTRTMETTKLPFVQMDSFAEHLFKVSDTLSIFLSSPVVHVDEIQILQWQDITYKELEELLSTILPRSLHFQNQDTAHFIDAPDQYLDSILKKNFRLELLTLRCARQLSWRQISRLLRDHIGLRLFFGSALVNSCQIFYTDQVPEKVQKLAFESDCLLYTDPEVNPSIPLGNHSKCIRIKHKMDTLCLHTNEQLREFLDWRALVTDLQA